jgi:Abortive infection alpha
MSDPETSSIPSVKIEAGISAKASLEVKAEVPKESMRKIIDSIIDIFSPFIEKRGLRGDQIRLQREDVLIEIARKARERVAIENIQELKAVPNKLLVPFLEKASLEDSDTSMQDSWAALLLSASRSYHARQLTFVDILSRLSSDELKVMETLCFGYDRFPELTFPTTHSQRNKDRVMEARKYLIHIDKGSEIFAIQNFQRGLNLEYGAVSFHAINFSTGGRTYFYAGDMFAPSNLSIGILEREQLIRSNTIYDQENSPVVGYVEATTLGVHFVQECSPSAREVAAKKAEGIVYARRQPR